jgi:hypothetical protein
MCPVATGAPQTWEIHDYVAGEEPDAAKRLGARIVRGVGLPKLRADLDRFGADPRVRELVMGGTGRVVLRRVRGKQARINTIRQGAQQRGKAKSEPKMFGANAFTLAAVPAARMPR